jgi:hypothetical protein
MTQPLATSGVPWRPDGPDGWKFDVLGYERRLNSCRLEVEASHLASSKLQLQDSTPWSPSTPWSGSAHAEVEATENQPPPPRNEAFVVGRVDGKARYLYRLERVGEDADPSSATRGGVLRLKQVLWHVDEADHQVYPVPSHVDLSKDRLRYWLEGKQYHLLQ